MTGRPSTIASLAARPRLHSIALASFVSFGLIASGPARAEAPAGCETKLDPQVRDFSQPSNLDLFKRDLLYYRCTRYDIEVGLVLQQAKEWVAIRRTEIDKAAVVLDIDETSLSNWKRIYTDDFAYIPNGACDFKKGEAGGDIDWQWSARAPAIEPTLHLYKLARCIDEPSPCKPVDVFFVTGRYESKDPYKNKTPTEWTLENLKNAKYEGVAPDHLYMRPADSSGPVANFKTAARIKIEERGFTIIANVGDQQSDLAGGHAERRFKVPNPFYFIP
jgi:hypothetical protein